MPIIMALFGCFSDKDSDSYDTASTSAESEIADSDLGNPGASDGSQGSADTAIVLDSAEPSDSGNIIWACDVLEWGICYDQSVEAGWDGVAAESSCATIAVSYGVQVDFIDNDGGCPTDTTIAECELTESNDFEYPSTAYYDATYDIETAEGLCANANGDFYPHES